MSTKFEVVPVGNNCYTINEGGRTIALISSQGYIDWLLTSPWQEGPLITEIVKETHLCYTLGYKLLLITPTPATELKEFSYRLEEDGARLVLTGYGETPNGNFASVTTAVLSTNPVTWQYEWQLETTITCTASAPLPMRGIEYNNVYPSKTGRCMLFAPRKEYSCTLMTDEDGVIWRFPHQHMMHYGPKLHQLQFAVGSVAGFFGEPAPAGCPVVIVQESSLPPDWGICDMYYDLHCCARINDEVAPGTQWRFAYQVKYLEEEEATRMLADSRPIQVTLEDWEQHDYPRIELGLNTFTHCTEIDRMDDASGFRQRPPQLVWDRNVGHREKGSLRITNATPQETVWSAEPPTQIPSETTLNITGMVKTEGVEGKGIYIRVRYHTFAWHPTPHVEWTTALESEPIAGTTDGWVKISVPELAVPQEHFDYLIWLDVVLEGKGTAWLTEVDVDLQYAAPEPPEIEEGGLNKTAAIRRRQRAGAAPLG